MEAITLNLSILGELTNEKLYQLCQMNKDVQIERTCKGDLVIMAPAGGGTGRKNIRISARLDNWNQKSNLGVAFDSSTGFTLPNSAVRSPDSSWITAERWAQLTEEEQEGFAPICPDFVIELMSPSDRLKKTQEKMQEWMDNGCRLGWLIDRKNEKLYIYRADGSMSVLESFNGVASGENVLPGFELDLTELK